MPQPATRPFALPLSRILPILITLVLLTLAAPDCSRGKSPSGKTGPKHIVKTSAGDTIALGFYNVENLFDLIDNGTEYPEFRPGALGWNKQTCAIKLANIAAVIAAMRVDLIGLCEVENRNALEGLRKELKRQGVDYPYAAIADGPNRTVTCPALLSRFSIVKSQGFQAGFGTPNRNTLEAQINCDGTTLTLFVNHWPAKAHPESQRCAIARALAGQIDRLGSRATYVIIGDLNTNYDEWRTFHTEGFDDTRGITGINTILHTVKIVPQGGGVTYVTKADLCRDIGLEHYDCWLDVPDDKRCSLTYHSLPETPDHVLLPQALLCGNTLTYCDHSFEAFTWGGKLLHNGETYGWQMSGFGRRRFHKGEGFSDHLPLRLRLVKGPFVAADPPGNAPAASAATPSTVAPGGFEASTEGWLPCGKAISVTRDSACPASGRFCLHLDGGAPERNCCAARTMVNRRVLNGSRWSRITFDIRGSGKLLVRARTLGGTWRYYTGAAFSLSRSARYFPVSFPKWKHVVLSFTAEDPSSPDLCMEFRAGKGEPFNIHVDNVGVR